VRHFLACCSKDAQGQETTVEIDVNNEGVSATEFLLQNNGLTWFEFIV